MEIKRRMDDCINEYQSSISSNSRYSTPTRVNEKKSKNRKNHNIMKADNDDWWKSTIHAKMKITPKSTGGPDWLHVKKNNEDVIEETTDEEDSLNLLSIYDFHDVALNCVTSSPKPHNSALRQELIASHISSPLFFQFLLPYLPLFLFSLIIVILMALFEYPIVLDHLFNLHLSKGKHLKKDQGIYTVVCILFSLLNILWVLVIAKVC